MQFHPGDTLICRYRAREKYAYQKIVIVVGYSGDSSSVSWVINGRTYSDIDYQFYRVLIPGDNSGVKEVSSNVLDVYYENTTEWLKSNGK